MDAISFREARSSDAAVLGELHVASWRETYAGLLPARMLDELSVGFRSAMWSAVLHDPAAHGGTAVFVAERERGIVGFGACAGQRDEVLKQRGFDGEIGALYVLRAFQRAGIGGSLVRLMARRLLDQGRTAAALWVLRANAPAREFYEKLGGVPAGERMDERSGEGLSEVAYCWSELSHLARWRQRSSRR